MNRFYLLFAALLCIFSASRLEATHIVGAELYYECIDSTTNTYSVTLTLYRDCFLGQADFDDPIYLFAFYANTGNIFQTIAINRPPQTPQIQPTDWSDCVATPPNICVEQGVYQTTLILPPQIGGYNLAWARCCRNSAITNLSAPLQEGITFLAHVPGPSVATCNSMPQFDQVPPVFLCANQPFAFDHSATDPDGDSLVYALTDPYTGLNFVGAGAGNPNFGGPQPAVDPIQNQMGPPPYQTVNFAPGYSFTDPFGSGNFNIDPQTGFITVTPTQAGIFVFSISVFEYRNGVLLSENRRDFQIHVLNCLPPGAPPTISHDLTGTNNSNDTIYVGPLEPFCYDISITDPISSDMLEAYSVSAAFGNGGFFPPAATFNWTGTNPVTGQVCWTPACAYDGQTIELIVGANDTEGCQNISNVFDTVWINIQAPPNVGPVITPDLSGLTTNGDTIFVNATNNFCYNFTVNDANVNDVLNAFSVSPVFTGPNPPSFNFTGTNPLQGQICWVPGCDLENQVIPLTIGAADVSPCNASVQALNTVYVKVLVPPNAPPTIQSNLNGTTHSNDTIIVDALTAFCYDFTANDVNTADILTAFSNSPIFNGPNAPTFNVTGTNPLSGQVCWTPGCQYENQVIPLVIGANDQGVCSNIGEDLDTVYVLVNVPTNNPPIITSSLNNVPSSNDTIIVDANDGFCYTFAVNDPNATDLLTGYTVSPVFNGPNPPSFTVSGSNPLTGQVCWTPGCEFAGQTIPLILGADDNGLCSGQASDLDTVYVRINTPPNDPPAASHNFGGLPAVNDTIFVDAEDGLCYDVFFTDINGVDSLTVFTVSAIFDGSPDAPVFTYTGINPVSGQVCWTPGCDFEGQLVELIIGAEDNGECDNILNAFDTVYIKINEPLTLPPIVGHDLTGTNHVGDTIYVDVGDGFCYDFFVADQTTDNGVDYTYEFQTLGGTNIGLGSANISSVGDSIIGTVCFVSDCSNGGSLYRIVLTGIDKATCPPFEQATDTVYVRVKTDFLSFAGPDTVFCEGTGGVQLSVIPFGGQGPYFYQWGCTDPPNCGFSSPYVNNPTVLPAQTTMYYVQITDNFGCTSEIDSIEVVVNARPIVDAGPDVFLCEDGPGTQLQAQIVNGTEAPGPYSYQWTPVAGLSNPNIRDPFAKPLQTTIYTLIVTDANGCSSVTTTLDTLSTITVSVNERPTVEAGPDLTICLGDTAQLLGFASEAGPDYRYEWTPATGLSDSSLQAPSASPPQTTTYFLISYSNECPSVADSVTVFVRTLPTVDPGTGYEICADDSVQLEGLAGGDLTATYTYAWTPVIGLDDPTSRAPMASPDDTTTYTVIATSSFGCESDPYSIFVNVLPTPFADAGTDETLCRGDSVRLAGSHVFPVGNVGTGPVFYAWTPVSSISGIFSPDPVVFPVQTVVYTLSVSHGACTTHDEVKIDVFDAVSVSIVADTNQICQGDSVQLIAIGGQGGETYTWSPTIGLSDPTIAAPKASPDTSITYSVIVEESTCKGAQSIRIEVNPQPEAGFYSSLTSGCEDLEVSFLQNSPNAVAYVWDFGDGAPISNEANPTHIYENPGSYLVRFTATGAGGCTNTSNETVISVYPKGVADFSSQPPVGSSVVLPEAQIEFLDRAEFASSYFWGFGDGTTSTEVNPVKIYREPGEYVVSLTITDEGGCTDVIRYGPYVIFAPDLLIPNVFTPNADGFNDVFRVEYSGRERFRMEVFDRWGVSVFETEGDPNQGWDGFFSAGGQAKEGVYYYRVAIGEKSYTGNVTLMR